MQMSSARSNSPVKNRRVVINDASCLIDLHKVNLVEVMLQLPYAFGVALPVAHNEVLDFSTSDWERFSDAGLERIDLDGSQVGRAFAHRGQYSRLTSEDCFSLVLAEDHAGSILLTGDAELRTVAAARGCEVHGVLWVTDEIHKSGLLVDSQIASCLNAWLGDPFVRLPAVELNARIRQLTSTQEASAEPEDGEMSESAD